MVELNALSRRERQIMEILYAAEGATVMEVVGQLSNSPTDKAVRRMLQILEEKGHVRRRKKGREYVYRPVQSKKQAGRQALRRLLETFFDGELDKAFAVHLGTRDTQLSDEQYERLLRMIQEARKKGR